MRGRKQKEDGEEDVGGCKGGMRCVNGEGKTQEKGEGMRKSEKRVEEGYRF